MKDSLGTCPGCTSDACYITEINPVVKEYKCFGCGFYTSDLLKEGVWDITEYEKAFPELYKDIKFTDKEGRVYYPQTIKDIEKGIVFPLGSSPEDWEWAAIKSIPMTKEETVSFKKLHNKDVHFKNDPKTLQKFGQAGFIDALDYAGLL